MKRIMSIFSPSPSLGKKLKTSVDVNEELTRETVFVPDSARVQEQEQEQEMVDSDWPCC
jgi:hypothetical protein